MNLQIRSMFDAEPTSDELISSRKRFAEQPLRQWNTQSSNPTPWKRMALEARTPNTHPRSRRIAPQESGDNSTEQGGMPKPQKERDRRKKRPLSPHADRTNHPTALKHLPHTRTKPPAQHHHVPKKPDRSACALWPHGNPTHMADLAWQFAPFVAHQTHGFARKWTTYLQVNNVSLVGREQEEKRRPRPRECKNDKTLTKGNRDKGKTKGQTWENGVKVKTWEKGKRTGEKEKKRPTGQQANGPTVQRANGPTANNGQCSPEYKEKKQYQEHFKKKTIHIIQILQIIWAISIIKNNVNCKNNIHGIKTICNIRIEKNTQCLQWNRIFFFKKKETEMLENPHKVFLIKVVI